ncbi:MAG: CD225/dispanin family protein [Bacteroidales bacterium]
MQKYFYLEGNVKLGPLTLDELKKRNINRETPVWCHPMPTWKPAGELPELEEMFSMIPPDFRPGVNSQTRPTSARAQFNMPKSWLVESILVTLFCCLPFGIVGVVYASRVDSKYAQGDYEGASQASREAGRWTQIGFFLGIVTWIFGLGSVFMPFGITAAGILAALGIMG